MNVREQCGTTLVSIMIGLFVSMIGVLTTLTLYKSLIQISGQLKVDAHLDRQMTNVLQYLHLEISETGFGMSSLTRNHISVDTTNVNEPTLYWRYMNSDGDVECRGVRDARREGVNTPTLNARHIIELQVADAAQCEESIDLNILSWVDKEVIAEFSGELGPVLQFELNEADCSSFGLGVAETRKYLKLEGMNSAVYARLEAGLPTDNISKNTIGMCLVNFSVGAMDV